MERLRIANLAIGRIGVGSQHRLGDYEEDTEAGRAVREVFDFCVEWIAADFPWRHLLAFQASNVLAGTTGTFAYRYAYPANAVAVWAIGEEGTDFDRLPRLDGGQRELAQVDGYLLSDVENGWLWYTRRPNSAQDFPNVGFNDALAWKLGVELALSLKADAKLAQFAQNALQRALPEAEVQSLQGNRAGRTQPLPSSLLAR